MKWYSEKGNEESGANEIIIQGNEENIFYLRPLRKGIEYIIEECGGYIEPPENRVEKIIEKYIKRIPTDDALYPTYLVKNFEYNDDKKRKKLKKALSKYAHKVREDEVIGFVDTSLFGNGGSGILFSKYGIAFDYAFEKIFARYEEIVYMSIDKGKDLVLYGHFAERKENYNNPSIASTLINTSVLEECLREIRNVI